VHGQVPVEGFAVHLGEARPAHDPGVGHQHVHSPEPFDGGVDEGGRPFLGRHVAGVGGGLTAGGLDLDDDRGGGVAVGAGAVHLAAQVVDDHRGPARREQDGVGAAEAAAGTGDHGDATIEAKVHDRRAQTATGA